MSLGHRDDVSRHVFVSHGGGELRQYPGRTLARAAHPMLTDAAAGSAARMASHGTAIRRIRLATLRHRGTIVSPVVAAGGPDIPACPYRSLSLYTRMALSRRNLRLGPGRRLRSSISRMARSGSMTAKSVPKRTLSCPQLSM